MLVALQLLVRLLAVALVAEEEQLLAIGDQHVGVMGDLHLFSSWILEVERREGAQGCPKRGDPP